MRVQLQIIACPKTAGRHFFGVHRRLTSPKPARRPAFFWKNFEVDSREAANATQKTELPRPKSAVHAYRLILR